MIWKPTRFYWYKYAIFFSLEDPKWDIRSRIKHWRSGEYQQSLINRHPSYDGCGKENALVPQKVHWRINVYEHQSNLFSTYFYSAEV